MKSPQPLVSKYGSLWARNKENMRQLKAQGRLFGIYVLYDGSMPVYIGRGKLWHRLNKAPTEWKPEVAVVGPLLLVCSP